MADFAEHDKQSKYRQHFLCMTQDKRYLFQHVIRVVKCMRECYLHRNDAGSVTSIMTLERCLHARSWHDSPTVLRQIRGLGMSYVRRLGLKGVKTFERLGQSEPEELEMWLNRSTPFGKDLLTDLERIPRYELKVFKESAVVLVYYSNTNWTRLRTGLLEDFV